MLLRRPSYDTNVAAVITLDHTRSTDNVYNGIHEPWKLLDVMFRCFSVIYWKILQLRLIVIIRVHEVGMPRIRRKKDMTFFLFEELPVVASAFCSDESAIDEAQSAAFLKWVGLDGS